MRFVLHPASRKIRFLPLVAATYFMVSGGPYGIEDILGGAGYGRAIVILLTLPLLWSLPTALMIGELAAAIPAEGGFYVWVRRGLGPFWGYQESWLSLTASIFDMALYPSIFVLYLGKFSPALTAGSRAFSGRSPCCLLLRVEPAWRAGGRRRFGLAVCVAAGAFRGLRRAGLLAWLHCASCHSLGPNRSRAWRAARTFHCYPGRALELHGLGQRLHHRARCRQPAAQLSARHDRRCAADRSHLRAAAGGHGLRGTLG